MGGTARGHPALPSPLEWLEGVQAGQSGHGGLAGTRLSGGLCWVSLLFGVLRSWAEGLRSCLAWIRTGSLACSWILALPHPACQGAAASSWDPLEELVAAGGS